MKVREICEMVEEQVVLACGGTEEEAEARRGAITRSCGVVSRVEGFCREYVGLDKLYRRAPAVEVECLTEDSEFPLSDIFADPCAGYVASMILRDARYRRRARALYEGAMEQLQAIGDFCECSI